MTEPRNALQRAKRTAVWGQWIAALAIAIFTIAMSLFVGAIAWGLPEAVSEIAVATDLPPDAMPPAAWQRAVTALTWIVPDLFGLAMMLLAFSMFRNFRRDNALTLGTAKRLRTIGWCILAIAPSRMIFDTLTISLFTAWAAPGHGVISVGLEDTDIYAVLIGLIIVATGHIMVQAVEYSDENKSFV